MNDQDMPAPGRNQARVCAAIAAAATLASGAAAAADWHFNPRVDLAGL